MKAFWKVLGFAALAAGLTPYKVEKDEETGESSYQALLWRITANHGNGDKKWDIDVNLNEGTLTSKLMQAAEKKEEAHLFSDELSVEYAAPSVDEVKEAVMDAAEEVKEEAAEVVEKAAEAAEEAVEAAEETVETVGEAVEEAVEAAKTEEPQAE